MIRLSSSVPECGHCACPRAARWRFRSWAFPSVAATPCSRASGRTETLGGGLKKGKRCLASSSPPPVHLVTCELGRVSPLRIGLSVELLSMKALFNYDDRSAPPTSGGHAHAG
ncbi:hypothetical protein AOLI_G00063280 [Acnodon oligacanthus]